MRLRITLITNMKAALDRAWEDAKDAALDTAERISPKRTGRYSRSWQWLGADLINTAPYEKHTDTGTTRYGGPGTARPWIAAGGITYTQHIFRSFSLAFRAGLKAERIIRGR